MMTFGLDQPLYILPFDHRGSLFPPHDPAKDPAGPSDGRADQAWVRPGGGRGIDAPTAPLVVAAGANVLVAGSAIFGDSNGVAAAMQRLRAAIR
jgi:hypothetical protein